MKNLHKTWFDYFLLLFFVIILVVTLYPFMNVLAISLNDATDTIKNINFIIPRHFTLANYKYVFKEGGIVQPLFISIAKTVIGTLAGVICTAMLAYTLSRRDFVFHKFFTLLFVITMYVGGGMIPEYLLIVRTLHLGDNFLVYIIPGLIWVYNMILVRSFIDGLPGALQEAAKLDGANDFQILWKIILPVSIPGIATLSLFYALGYWNQWFNAMLYIDNSKLFPLQYLLMRMLRNADAMKEMARSTGIAAGEIPTNSLRMATTVVAIGPIIFLYPYVQKYFTSGLTVGAIKG